MKKLKIKDSFYKLIDGFSISESSREVKYSNVVIDFTNKSIADLPLKYQECQLVDVDNENNILELIYTGYVSNYTLPKMKNKLEYRELEIDLLSPLAIATLRTVDAIGTYNLQALIMELIQPLIDDGFELKEFNIGNNKITVNFLTETVESSLNKLSNQFNFWWYIDKNKNIYINDIKYIFSKHIAFDYNDYNKINGLIDFEPSMESINYCNTVDFTNVRLITKSSFTKNYYKLVDESDVSDYGYYNPIITQQIINPGDEITFDIPFLINTDKRAITQGSATISNKYFDFQKIIWLQDGSYNYSRIFQLVPKSETDNTTIIPSNVSISDSFNQDNEFVLVKDSFFDNLIVGMKYNGNSSIDVGIIESDTALMWAKVRIDDNREIEINKDIISTTGIVERQIDMNEQWKTYEELLEIADNLIGNNIVNVEDVKLVADLENNFKIGDIIRIDKPSFLTSGNFIIVDKERKNSGNVDKWQFKLKNTNILESYIDLFRASEGEVQSDRVYGLITADYSREGIRERYEVEVL